MKRRRALARVARPFHGPREGRFLGSVAHLDRAVRARLPWLALLVLLTPCALAGGLPPTLAEGGAWLLLPPLGFLASRLPARTAVAAAGLCALLVGAICGLAGASLAACGRALLLELLLCGMAWNWTVIRTRHQRREFLLREHLTAIAERRRAAVEEERRKLAFALELKQRFFASTYHDLQQPLSTINLFTRVMARRITGIDQEAARRDLAVIERASRDIGAMFKGVRELWELGHYQPAIEDINVAGIVQEVVNETTQFARDRGLALRLRAPRRPGCFGVSDRNLIKRAVTNLVVNGLRYTDKGGVLVGCVAQPGHIRIHIYDTGIGIPKELHDRIFEEHFQVHAGQQRRGGLGLGLAIVRRIEANLPGHRVSLRSRPGRGSHFWIDLPAAEAPETGETTWSTGTRDSLMMRGRFIAVVDDQEDLLRGMLETLIQVGAHARGARTLDDAIDLFDATARCPDLLITDFRLAEGRTGLDVIAAMRDIYDWAPPIPILIVSAEQMTAATLGSLPPGTRVLQKPLESGRLLSAISEILSSRTT